MTNTINKIVHNGDEYMLPRQKALVITLTSAGWTNNEQTVTATGVTASNSIIISPVPTYISDYTDAKIYCSAQGTDSLTFTCDSTPASDIEVNVLVLSAEAGSTPTPPSPGWQPGANTIIYLPMDTDLLDHSLSPKTVNNVGSVAIVSNVGGCTVGSAQFNSSSKNLNFTNTINMSGTWTISCWGNITLNNSVAQIFSQGIPNTKQIINFAYMSSASRGLTVSNFYDDVDVGSFAGRDGTWHLLTATYTGSADTANNLKIYVDGSLVKQGQRGGTTTANMTGYVGNYQTNDNLNGYLSQFILEDKTRTAQEISDYYDQTKADYGIS